MRRVIAIGMSFVVMTVAIAWIVAVMDVLPIPLFDRNSVTVMLQKKDRQVAVALALAEVVGEPTATLDTRHVHRFLFKDGTSVDWLAQPPGFKPMYNVVALKTIVIGFWRSFFTSPVEEAQKVKVRLEKAGYEVQVVERPDPAFPSGKIVLLLSSAFMHEAGDGTKFGAALLFRNHAFVVGGQRPEFGSPF